MTAATSLNEAAREIAVLTRSQIQAHGASLRTELGHVPPTVSDRVQLQQVMVNLVVNAAEAMRDVHDRPREVTLRTHGEAGRVYVEVSDHGAGLPADHGEQVFAPFYTTKPGGMGMGLSICRTIVESHGGKLTLELTDGPGSRFVLDPQRRAAGGVTQGSRRIRTASGTPTWLRALRATGSGRRRTRTR